MTVLAWCGLVLAAAEGGTSPDQAAGGRWSISATIIADGDAVEELASRTQFFMDGGSTSALSEILNFDGIRRAEHSIHQRRHAHGAPIVDEGHSGLIAGTR